MTMNVGSLMPSVNVNVDLGALAGPGGSELFNPSGATSPGVCGGMGGATSECGGDGSSGLVKELLRTALSASSPGEKSDLIKAALDLMGGSGQAAGATGAGTGSDPSGSATGGLGSGSASGSSGALSVSGNSVDTGRYTITASTSDDGSLTIKDNQTGATDEVWGDPHLNVNGKDVADFQKDGLTINLPDGTRVELQPTATNSDGKSHLQQAVISKDGQAVTMSGFTGGGGVQTSAVQSDSESLEQSAMTPDETVLDASGSLSNLDFTNADGSLGAALGDSGSEQDLDGSGGADPSSASSSSSGSTDPTAANGTGDPSGTGGHQRLVDRLLHKAEHSADPQTKSDLIKAALDLMNGGGSASSTGASSPSASGTGGAGGSTATQLLQQAENSSDPSEQNDLIKAALDEMNGGSGNQGLAGRLLQQAENSSDPQEQNDLIKAAMDLMGGGSGGTASLAANDFGQLGVSAGLQNVA